jgi:predicted anti-sigma-YlaC factor YlaD
VLSPVPDTDCMRAREGASARLDGELGQLDQARLEGHLAVCAECRAFAESISAAAGELRATPLEAAPAGLFVPRRRHTIHRSRFVSAAAAILVVAAAAGSSFLLGQQIGARGPSQVRTVLAAEGPAHHNPSVVAMLHARPSWPRQNRRAVAL